MTPHRTQPPPPPQAFSPEERAAMRRALALAGALLADHLVDRLVWYSAPRLLGADGAPAVRGLDVPTCAQAPGFRVVGARRIGEDVRVVLEPQPKESL
ncbi:dihydrofolate reductase family protein [Kitasatospora sp. NPDC048194]|uniref:dihydrofolate reductase family protein n=1 Tax=Kitasatospora sp. NPDC048194 TaxID=3364045 RepID=UPI003713069F